jgi:hypothetical protein
LVRAIAHQRFNLKQLNEGEVKEQYQVTIKNKFAALENLDDNGGISRAWELLAITSKFQPKRMSVFVNRSIINHVL